ncbi:MAG: hypothetical protein COU63_02460 [Candidatus Pacebacteria bacterium CG10_big_fil_rev_8_21_14_0_10_36_11]|nr:metal ABC transporter ATP-binding protein [Candidatus Pacearchaeota archaeon]OIP74294.1 MAG: hypothetical protein AUK08_00715 [Candidatus Pacebacteria bacterium CG2_30_36_39]PIR64856.1 MAG: hypothetical protein COU63_02460 [Candidatus Pacebacteria bacterium CG10_big_fil_rev_8_21_14_0_10_36_11]PJC42451.1 MAG: hypothetical protein CO040_04315 [Candidatus Pacebacteria bacterium CG_4_9_14_0_2_um_filter_36_8]
MNSLVNINQLKIRYQDQSNFVINGITLAIPKGEITALIGPNGSGKSSFIKAILGLIPFTGTIDFNWEENKHLDSSIGYLPQRFSIEHNFPLTVEEFMGLALVECSHTTGEKNIFIDGSLTKVNLFEKKKSLLTDLSGGQLQRILLARALVHQPKLLVLDEPEAGIDLHAEESLYLLLKDLVVNNGMTILIASHELHILPEFANNVICFHQGSVCQGKPEHVMSSDLFKKVYGESISLHDHGHHKNLKGVKS